MWAKWYCRNVYSRATPPEAMTPKRSVRTTA